MVATATPEPPPLTALRCVYRPWVVPTGPPQLVWDDSGARAGGWPPSLTAGEGCWGLTRLTVSDGFWVEKKTNNKIKNKN